jgi:hypothetical protein
MTAFPNSALATPAPRRSATAMTSSVAPAAPAPTSIATFRPALSTAAARSRSSSVGTTRGSVKPVPECTVPCLCGGSFTAGSSWRSLGRMMQVTVRCASAFRMARSTRWRSCAALDAVCTYSWATSLKRAWRSTSCW